MKKKKKPFETVGDNRRSRLSGEPSPSEKKRGPQEKKIGFFADPGVRETVESIVVAVMLALLFRAYEAEAFVIPTGSMAPTLQGRHLDLHCEDCGYNFRVGASGENPDRQPKIRTANGKIEIDPDREWLTGTATCPICRFPHDLERKINGWKSNQDSFFGDRIIVSKFAYELGDPKRWDVIVFKYPGNAKQNYIKRLVGLPDETLKLEFGNVWVRNESGDFEVVRKPHHKLKVMLQEVDDTHYIGKSLQETGWPSRWNEWSAKESQSKWLIDSSQTHPVFQLEKGQGTRWLRYRHIVPRTDDWINHLSLGELPPRLADFKGQLIGDFYPYNYYVPQRLSQARGFEDWMEPTHASEGRYLPGKAGVHWVADLACEAFVEVRSDEGILKLDLVKAGVHFSCEIDVKTGRATLACDQEKIGFVSNSQRVTQTPTAVTPIRGKGSYKIRYANADDKIYLWVNEKVIQFDGPTEYQNFQDRFPAPQYSKDDPGDAEPAGIGGENIELQVTRLKILRDIYYINSRTGQGIQAFEYRDYPTNYYTFSYENSVFNSNRFSLPIRQVMEDPLAWSTPEGLDYFSKLIHDSPEYYFELNDNQFMPLGDNSPSSQDARAWDHGHFFDRKYLIGKALFIYWPHSWRNPMFFPNFKRMSFIR